jgi:hypothetical protein
VLGALALLPLLHDLVTIEQGFGTGSGLVLGSGIPVGLVGAVVTMIGSGLLYRTLGRDRPH